MATIEVKGLKFHAFHGCHPEERRVGGPFEVDVQIEADITKAAGSDNLEQAIDYVRIMGLVQTEMNNRCDLIETVAVNIGNSIRANLGVVGSIRVAVRKIQPPVGYELSSVSVIHTI
ncbi:MAG: dihydroneopterin aldolase [Flavobacteriales bacterium]